MRKTFRLQGLECANCAAKMERAISELEGVDHCTVNFMTTKMVIEGQEERMPAIIEMAERIIRKFEPDTIMKKA